MLPERKVLTGRGIQLYEALAASGDWMSRAQLASVTGKNTLSPHDKGLLERMRNADLIEMRERIARTPVGVAWEYKIKRSQHDSI